MKAVQVQKHGGPEVLTLVDLPVPQPKPAEVIVKISAAGVVTEVGSAATEWKPGDRVAYTGVAGAYAEYAAVPAAKVVRVPHAVTDQQAAAVMLQGMTAHYLVRNS